MPPELLAAERTIEAKWGTCGTTPSCLLPARTWRPRSRPTTGCSSSGATGCPPVSWSVWQPLLPGPATAAANRERWGRFWQQEPRRDLREWVRSEGARLGFAPDRLRPRSMRSSPWTPGPTAEDDLRQARVGRVDGSLIVRTERPCHGDDDGPRHPATAEIFARNCRPYARGSSWFRRRSSVRHCVSRWARSSFGSQVWRRRS